MLTFRRSSLERTGPFRLLLGSTCFRLSSMLRAYSGRGCIARYRKFKNHYRAVEQQRHRAAWHERTESAKLRSRGFITRLHLLHRDYSPCRIRNRC
jgi:hypothetical protein